jgi:Transglycosylase SLT domain
MGLATSSTMMQQPRFSFALFFLAFIAGLSWPASSYAALPAVGQVSQDQRKFCSEPIRRQEREAGIPGQLLAAVALAESGRWDKADSANFAWPWTVTTEGKGQFFATKAEAIAQVKRLRARGLRNIDVGCMQINLMHHPDAFANLEDAFDPETNVAYATAFLKQLFEKHRSWIAAVGHYHSSTPEFHMRYRQKVTKLWNDERRREAEARRQQTIAAYQLRRQQALLQKTTQKEQDASLIDKSGDEPLADNATLIIADSGADSLSTSRQQFTEVLGAKYPQFAPQPSPASPPPASLRIQSQIPSGVTPRNTLPAPAAQAPTAARIQPRSTLVPLERRF